MSVLKSPLRHRQLQTRRDRVRNSIHLWIDFPDAREPSVRDKWQKVPTGLWLWVRANERETWLIAATTIGAGVVSDVGS
jgi:hypothetical protein